MLGTVPEVGRPLPLDEVEVEELDDEVSETEYSTSQGRRTEVPSNSPSMQWETPVTPLQSPQGYLSGADTTVDDWRKQNELMEKLERDAEPKRRVAVVRDEFNEKEMKVFQYLRLNGELLYTDSDEFVGTVSVLTILNTFVMGLEADLGCWDCDLQDRIPWFLCDNIFTVVFLLEMVLRINAASPPEFFLSDDLLLVYSFNHSLKLRVLSFARNPIGSLKLVNCLDFFVVILRAFDTWVFQLMGWNTYLKVLSCFRVARICLLADRLRLMRSFKELWLLTANLSSTYKVVGWAVVFVTVIVWVLGIALTILLGKDEDAQFDYTSTGFPWTKMDYWGSVPKSMFSLFQVMTLDHWSTSVVGPVFQRYRWVVLLVVPFIIVSTIGLLNLIVAVIVEGTLASSRNNEEKWHDERGKADMMVMNSLKGIFEEADTDHSGELDRNELRTLTQKGRVRDRLKLLGIRAPELEMLYDVLSDGHPVPIDKFFRGCSRLNGDAMACDMHRLSVDMGRKIQWSARLREMNHKTNDLLAELIDDVSGLDRDIFRSDDDFKDPVLQHRRERAQYHQYGFKAKPGWPEKEGAMPSSIEAHFAARKAAPAAPIRGILRRAADAEEGRGDIRQEPRRIPNPPPLPPHLRDGWYASDEDEESLQS